MWSTQVLRKTARLSGSSAHCVAVAAARPVRSVPLDFFCGSRSGFVSLNNSQHSPKPLSGSNARLGLLGINFNWLWGKKDKAEPVADISEAASNIDAANVDTATAVSSVSSASSAETAATSASESASASENSELLTQLQSFTENADAGVIDSNHIGYLQSVGIGNGWWPSDLIARSLEAIHVYLGVPWWAAIVILCCTWRILCFPLFARAADMTARVNKMKPELSKLDLVPSSNTSMEDITRANHERAKLNRKYGIKMRYLFAPMLIQFPFTLGTFYAIRAMASLPVDGFTNQGILWFTDLTVTDPYYLLPIMTAGMLYLQMSLNETFKVADKMIRRFIIASPLVSIAISALFPSALLLYFLINTVTLAIQTFLLRHNSIRRLLGIHEYVPRPPPGPNESGLQDTMKKFKQSMEQSRIMKEEQERLKRLAELERSKSGPKVARRVGKKRE